VKNRLFWRMFGAFVATLFLTVTVLSLMVVVMVREERRDALEADVRMQARDVARLLSQRDSLSIRRNDASLSNALNWKITEISETHDASVWLVTSGGATLILGRQEYTEEQLNDASVLEQIYKVLSGEEIRVQGLIPELGSQMVTIGVPWTYMGQRVVGAVLLHISIESLSVDYSDMVRNALIAAAVALVTGAALAYFISQKQTEPLRRINQAVTRFSAGHLEERVDIRGDEQLTQLGASLNQMAQDLENLEESRRSFVASVSHELRSPLTSISGYVQGMLDGTIPESDRARSLGVVLLETARLTKLVNDLLELSKFESGDFPLAKDVFDIDELLRVELIKFEKRIEEKRLEIEADFREEPCYVLADADRIRQIVTNLIDNAVKFSPEGAKISLGTLPAGGLCFVRVRNEGAPIPQEDIPFLFDRFYKVDKAHTSGMGTGLGLSIVKRILEQHGQTIKVASGAGGTEFTFTLERAKQGIEVRL
jgi:signal transduction histidine kinase